MSKTKESNDVRKLEKKMIDMLGKIKSIQRKYRLQYSWLITTKLKDLFEEKYDEALRLLADAIEVHERLENSIHRVSTFLLALAETVENDATVKFFDSKLNIEEICEEILIESDSITELVSQSEEIHKQVFSIFYESLSEYWGYDPIDEK
jgi:hypothetical protein